MDISSSLFYFFEGLLALLQMIKLLSLGLIALSLVMVFLMLIGGWREIKGSI